MHRRIVGYHQNDEQDWVAELECGHSQHVRHDPPWQNRPWVLTPETRAAHLGTILSCRLCDTEPPEPDTIDPYEDARLQGLCVEGAEEVARGSAQASACGPASPPRLEPEHDHPECGPGELAHPADHHRERGDLDRCAGQVGDAEDGSFA